MRAYIVHNSNQYTSPSLTKLPSFLALQAGWAPIYFASFGGSLEIAELLLHNPLVAKSTVSVMPDAISLASF